MRGRRAIYRHSLSLIAAFHCSPVVNTPSCVRHTCDYDIDPTQPIGNWKTAWKNARKAAQVACRFHDLRHSAVTRLLKAGVSFPIVASLLGWSPITTTKMAKRSEHIGSAAIGTRSPLLIRTQKRAGEAQKRAQCLKGRKSRKL